MRGWQFLPSIHEVRTVAIELKTKMKAESPNTSHKLQSLRGQAFRSVTHYSSPSSESFCSLVAYSDEKHIPTDPHRHCIISKGNISSAIYYHITEIYFNKPINIRQTFNIRIIEHLPAKTKVAITKGSMRFWSCENYDRTASLSSLTQKSTTIHI